MQQKACQFFLQIDKTSIFLTLSYLTFCFSFAMKAKSSIVTNVINVQLQLSFMNIWVGCGTLRFKKFHECSMLLVC
jgi:hypothetical protein